MARQNLLLHNPASEIVLPRMEHRLPKYVLTAEEAEQIIQQAVVTDPEGLRDRAILETFYSTGMRRMELANVKIYDIDADRTTLTIRQGKGRKDRVIPIGERALAWIDKYMRESRPQLLTGGGDDGTVFLTHMGEPFDRKQLTSLVRRYLIDSKVGKMGGCHLFRHTVATLMLENGADIRVIQEMLGHAKLTTHGAVHARIHQPAAPGLLGHASRRAPEAARGGGNHGARRRSRGRTARHFSRRIRRGPGRCVATFPTNPGPRWSA